MRYPVKLTRDTNDTFLVTFPDFPEAHTFGETRDEALARAVDALETAIQGRISDREEIPHPGKTTRASVQLPTKAAVAVEIYRRMRGQGISKAALTRRLGWHRPQVDRVLDLRHGTRLDHIDAVLRALGARLDVKAVSERRRPAA